MPHPLTPFLITPQVEIYRRPEFCRELAHQLALQGAEPENFEIESGGNGDQPVTLRGWLFRGVSGRPLVVLSHGVHAGRADMADLCLLLQRQGFNAACYDARAHGLSDGRHICFGHHERHDLLQIARTLQGETQAPFVLLGGLSMGGALSLLASDAPEIAGVVTFSAYWDFRRCFERFLSMSVPGLPREEIQAILDDASSVAGFDEEKSSPCLAIPRHDRFPPLLVLHGACDELIPTSQAQALERAWQGPVTLRVFPEAGHADIVNHPGAREAFLEFVEARSSEME